MDSIDYDVYIGFREGAASGVAESFATTLRARGFRVCLNGRDKQAEAAAGQNPAQDTPAQPIDDAADFIILLGPGAIEPALADERDPLRVTIRRAFAADRNVIPVHLKGYVAPPSLPEDLAPLERCHPVAFNPAKTPESIAKVAHRLTSHATLDDRKSNRQAKQIAWLVAVFLVGIVAVGSYRAWRQYQKPILDVRPLPPFALYWTAFGQRLQGGQWVEVPVQDGAALSAGDQLKVTFTSNGDGYAYVVGRDRRGQITVLFPSRMMAKASRVKAGQTYDAPMGGGWFDATDLDVLYIVGSYDPMENLESLVEEHAEETSPEARQSLLDSTIAGLLDGRHAIAGAMVRTRAGRPIAHLDDTLPATTRVTTPLSSGARVTHDLVVQRGLHSAAVELRPRR